MKFRVISSIYKFRNYFFNHLFFAGKTDEKREKITILPIYKNEKIFLQWSLRCVIHILRRHLFQNLGECCGGTLEPILTKTDFSLGQEKNFPWAREKILLGKRKFSLGQENGAVV